MFFLKEKLDTEKMFNFYILMIITVIIVIIKNLPYVTYHIKS